MIKLILQFLLGEPTEFRKSDKVIDLIAGKFIFKDV